MKSKAFFLLYNTTLFFLLLIIISASCQKTDYQNQINPILDKYVEAWNTGNLKSLDAITSSNFELRINPDFKPKVGQKLLKEEITNTRSAFPDFHLKIDEKLFVGDSAVVIRWTLTGTNTGKSSMPPTGNKIDITGFSVIFFADDLLTGEWIAFSDLAWVTQLGFSLTPPEFIEK